MVALDVVEDDAGAAVMKVRTALARLTDTEIGANISDAAVRALVADHRIDEAQRLLADPHNFAGPARAPYLDRAGGALALAQGRTADAIAMLEGATRTSRMLEPAGRSFGPGFCLHALARLRAKPALRRWTSRMRRRMRSARAFTSLRASRGRCTRSCACLKLRFRPLCLRRSRLRQTTSILGDRVGP